MAYTNPNGQTAPNVGDVVLVTPLQPTMEQATSFFGQVTAVDTLTATVRSVDPPANCHKFSIMQEVQFTTVSAARLRIGNLVGNRNYP